VHYDNNGALDVIEIERNKKLKPWCDDLTLTRRYQDVVMDDLSWPLPLVSVGRYAHPRIVACHHFDILIGHTSHHFPDRRSTRM
jgi:hypothetical protein